MRLITFNTWQGRLSRNFLSFFEQHETDILCLQELNSSHELIMDWPGAFCGRQEIQKVSGLENQYYSPTYSYKVMSVEVEFGNGMLSRYPINNERTVFTHGQFTKITQVDNALHNTRNAQIVTIASPWGDVTVVNTHGHWGTDPMGSELAMQRLEKLAQALKDIQGPLIVAGDFNLDSKSDAIQSFKETLGLTDLTLEHGLTNTLNNLVTPYEVACDHIFINDSIEVVKLQLHTDLLSDHNALALDFDIRA
jgi:endonuclease/exonuclease/phosphatase family metal-dependent hydrolase